MHDLLNFFTPWRLKWYPRLILAGVLAGVLIAVFAGGGAKTLTGRLGGDFPAFYGAGRTVAQGDFQSLYSYAHQQAMQKGLFPDNEYQNTMPFPYPPFVALAYYPLALVNYRVSFLAHTLLMMLTVAITVWLLVRRRPVSKDYGPLLLIVMLLYYPMLRSVLGGQNTSITLLLFVVVWYAGSLQKEWLAGVFLGLMLFKPQYGVPLIGLHLLAGRWRSVISGVLVAATLYFATAHFFGFFWIKSWLDYASWVSSIAASIDGANSVCWLGFFQAILGAQSKAANILGWSMAVGTVISISVVWFRARHKHDLSGEFALAAVALILMQPHVMYYDMALVLFTYLTIMRPDGTKAKLFILLWILAISQVAARPLGFSPLFFLLLWSGAVSIRLLLHKPVAPRESLTAVSG